MESVIDTIKQELKQGLVSQTWMSRSEPTPFAPVDLKEKVLPSIRDLSRKISSSINVNHAQDELFDESLNGYPEQVWKILATMIYSDCTIDALRKLQVKFFVSTSNSQRISDNDLPLSLPDVEELFQDDPVPTKFHQNQFIFCAIIFTEGLEVICNKPDDSMRPLPFLASESIGYGSSGEIHKVVIESGYVKDKDGRGWGEARTYAWKQFNPRGDTYRAELDVLKGIQSAMEISERTSGKTSQNILTHSGSLLHGTTKFTCGIYFDLANCDLHYLLSEDTSTRPPESQEDIKMYLKRFYGLLQAIDHLHNGLELEDSKISIYHLDLKPKNILVFNKGTKEELWKIHDFGMSRIKYEKPPGRYAGGDQFSGTDLRREGAFLAPETNSLERDVYSKADIWSLGCILCIVLRYLFDGREGVKKFQSEREDAAVDGKDTFWNLKEKTFRSNKVKVRNPAIDKWFKGLAGQLKIHKSLSVPPICDLVAQIISLLNKFLKIDQKDRAGSKQLVNDFSGGFEACRTYNLNPQESLRKQRLFKSFHLEKSSTPHSPLKSQKWDLRTTPSSYKCKFSPCGEYLVFVDEDRKVFFFYDTNNIMDSPETAPYKSHKILTFGPTKLADFSLAHNYLIAFTENPFDLLIFDIEEIKNSNTREVAAKQIRFPNLPQICKLAISPNGKTLVMVLRDSNNGFYAYETLLNELVRHAGTASMSSTSRKEGLTDYLDCCRRVTFPGKSKITHVQSLKFSANSEIVVLMSQPIGANQLLACPFSLVDSTNRKDRKYEHLFKCGLTDHGDIDKHDEHLTAWDCLTEDSIASVFLVLYKNSLIEQPLHANCLKWSRLLKSLELLDMLPREENDEYCTFIGRTTPGRGHVFALYVRITRLNEDIGTGSLNIEFSIDLQCTSWSPGIDSAVAIRKGREILVARVEGQGIMLKTYRELVSTTK